MQALCCSHLRWIAPSLTQCRFDRHWRDKVMLTGLITTVAAATISIFQGAFFSTALILSAGGVIAFGGHYVMLYANMEALKTQITDLESQVTNFSRENDRLAQQIIANQELYETAADRLGEAFRNLRAVYAEINEAQEQLRDLIRSQSSIHATIESETRHLHKVREDLGEEVTKLKRITTILLRLAPMPIPDNFQALLQELQEAGFFLVENV